MALLSSFKRWKKTIKNANGNYEPIAWWTRAEQVDRGNTKNGTTVEDSLNALEEPAYTQAASLSSLSSGETYKTAFGKISKAVSDYIEHKTSVNAHNDIRELINALTNRLNALADSDDETLDQLSEIVAYIKSNRSLIENVTINKVNVADIIDRLDSMEINKPLSANQGKILKDLIDEIIIALTEVDTKIENSETAIKEYADARYASKNAVNSSLTGINKTISEMSGSISRLDAKDAELAEAIDNIQNDLVIPSDLVTTTDLNTAIDTAKSNVLSSVGTKYTTTTSFDSFKDTVGNTYAKKTDLAATNSSLSTTNTNLTALETSCNTRFANINTNSVTSSGDISSGGSITGKNLNVGTWKISTDSELYTDITISSSVFRFFLQPVKNNSDPLNTWVISSQYKDTDGFKPYWYITAQGKLRTLNNIDAAGIINSDTSITIKDDQFKIMPTPSNTSNLGFYNYANGTGFYFNLPISTATVDATANNNFLISAAWYRARFNTTQFNANVSGQVCIKSPSGYTHLQAVCTQNTDGRKVDRVASNSSGTVSVYGEFGTSGTYVAKSVATSSSDIRLKENIEPTMVNGLEAVNKIKLVQFDWKDSGAHWNVGMVADEIEEIDENLTFGGGYDEDGVMNAKGVNDFYLLGYCVKAIQELSEENKRLHEEINILKKKMEKM
ncbi:MAG: tail fiber domain-containing protein [Muribaculaceae bacterium]|nr:tail fiber domain-containing protein [Muribaculaceae bacterium]MCM1399943.1 tail fiber domain-containing protein [Clostridium sp.]MCM1460745.1 tail fiber domain-containing protein [Bacteroides sp.]